MKQVIRETSISSNLSPLPLSAISRFCVQPPGGRCKWKCRREGFSTSVRAPPHGVVEVSGEVCDKESGSLFVGEWSVDGGYTGYFTGSLADLGWHPLPKPMAGHGWLHG